MSQLTTHVLDTSSGQPAQGVAVILEQSQSGHWNRLSEGFTNQDGRITRLPDTVVLTPGVYRLIFDTASYFSRNGIRSFYPKVTVEFEVTDDSHYHVPLLLSPYGYSTYRGS